MPQAAAIAVSLPVRKPPSLPAAAPEQPSTPFAGLVEDAVESGPAKPASAGTERQAADGGAAAIRTVDQGAAEAVPIPAVPDGIVPDALPTAPDGPAHTGPGASDRPVTAMVPAGAGAAAPALFSSEAEPADDLSADEAEADPTAGLPPTAPLAMPLPPARAGEPPDGDFAAASRQAEGGPAPWPREDAAEDVEASAKPARESLSEAGAATEPGSRGPQDTAPDIARALPPPGGHPGQLGGQAGIQFTALPAATPESTAPVPTAAATPQAPAAQTQTVPLAGLPVEIAARARDGASRFEIRLDPPELGRIDVRLEVDRDGNATSRLLVDRPDTLDLLRRDAHTLERALQDAGLKTGDGGLQFSLRDPNGQGSHAGQHQRTTTPEPQTVVVPDPAPTPHAGTAYGRALRGGEGIDIRV